MIVFPSHSFRIVCATISRIRISQPHNHTKFRLNHHIKISQVQNIKNPQNIGDARASQSSVSIWNSEIRELIKNGRMQEALRTYNRMQSHSVVPDKFTFPAVLKACALLGNSNRGKNVHNHILKMGLQGDLFVGTALIDMYAKCGNIDHVCKVFDKMSSKDTASWNSMIAGFSKMDRPYEALTLFCEMQNQGFMPNRATVTVLAPVCSALCLWRQGASLHGYVLRRRFYDDDVSLKTSLVDMYSKCGFIDDAERVFDGISKRDVICWNAMIAGYNHNGHAGKALMTFKAMRHSHTKPNSSTLVSALPACASIGCLNYGKCLHSSIICNGLMELDMSIGNSLLDMYAKCRDLMSARSVFDNMTRDYVSWTVMVSCLAQNGQSSEALRAFHRMMDENIEPNSATVLSVLPACSELAALQKGQAIHAYVIRNWMVSDGSVATSLLAMYAKCGCIGISRRLFDDMLEKDVVSWSAMIAAYGMHGCCNDAIALFYEMQKANVKPDHVTFVGILSACSHKGAVDKGWHYFNIMKNYSISPTLEHYACMVDLLGRTGRLDQAYKLILGMPMEADASIWASLLGACKIHSDIALVKSVLSKLSLSSPENVGNYIMASNIYASAGMWDDVAHVRNLLRSKGLKKSIGCSWIEIKGQVHVFVVGDKSHDAQFE